VSVFADTVAELRSAARAGRSTWGPTKTRWLVVFLLACALPAFAPGWVHLDALAAWLYLALAATGLGLVVGVAGLPSLGQGAFMSFGAFTTAALSARAGWAPLATVPVAVTVAFLGGLLAGLVVVRLPLLYVAVSTWILTWLVLLAATEFPSIAGGAQGYVVRNGIGETAHYELGLVLTVTAIGAVSVLRRNTSGIRLRATADHAAAAQTLGVPRERLLLGAFAASAAVGGLAGSLAVQLAGVSDPNAFGPFTSFQLLVAVLLGGLAYAAGGAVGVALLGSIAVLASLLSNSPQLEPLLASLLLLAVLALGGEGVLPGVARRHSSRPGGPVAGLDPAPAPLVARDLTKRYGAVTALAGFDLSLQAGERLAVIGANGSGKTSLLRALAGAIALDDGTVALGDERLHGRSEAERARLGLVRTLQDRALFGSLTVEESVLVGAALHRRHGGALRAVAGTPKARREAASSVAQAAEALELVGLSELAGTPVLQLDGFQQRLVMLAAALATRPRVLLLDEPAAGLGPGERDQLAALLLGLHGKTTLLFAEHDLRLVRAVAQRLVVLADGELVADGDPAEILTASTGPRT
jgi:branched-chain amino acid transport system permease protein